VESGSRTGSVDRALCLALCAAAVIAGWQGGAEAQKDVEWCLLDRPRQWTTEGSYIEEKKKGDTNAKIYRFGCARHQLLVWRHQREGQKSRPGGNRDQRNGAGRARQEHTGTQEPVLGGGRAKLLVVRNPIASRGRSSSDPGGAEKPGQQGRFQRCLPGGGDVEAGQRVAGIQGKGSVQQATSSQRPVWQDEFGQRSGAVPVEGFVPLSRGSDCGRGPVRARAARAVVEPTTGGVSVRGGGDVPAVRRELSCEAAGGQAVEEGISHASHQSHSADRTGNGRDPGGAADGHRGHPLSLSYQSAAVVLQRFGHRDAQLVGLDTWSGRLAAGQPGQDPGPGARLQPDDEGHLQGRGRYRTSAPNAAALQRLSETAAAGHQAPDGQADAGSPYCGYRARDVEEQGGIRPEQVSLRKINARFWGEALTGTAPFRLEATASESSKVRGVASQIKLGRRSDPDTSIEERNSVLKPPFSGYAPSEYLTKPWPTEALIEAWCPFFYGAYRGFNDYGHVPESPGRRIAREDLKTAASPRAVDLTHRLAVRDVAPRPITKPDSVRSNEDKVRWTDKFVLDRTFDRSFICPLRQF